MPDLKQEYRVTPVGELQSHPANARRGDVKRIAKSIRANGLYGAIVAQKGTGFVLAGNHRLKAAIEQGLAEVPVTWIECDEEAGKKILVADNAASDAADWDPAALDDLLASLPDVDPADLAMSESEIRAVRKERNNKPRNFTATHLVVVECRDEADQASVLAAEMQRGRPCRAVIGQALPEKKAPRKQAPAKSFSDHIRVESRIEVTPRVMQVCSMFDVPPQPLSVEEWNLHVELPPKWSVGAIIGPSGSGKSTLARRLWPDAQKPMQWSAGRAVVDDFPADMACGEISELLSSVGFSSAPQWMRPFGVLSTGQKFRVEVARMLAEAENLIVCDEYTSVVDRRVAQVGSHAVQACVRRRGQQFVAVSCHSDILEWLRPDWVIEMPHGTMARECLSRWPRRPPINLEIRRVHHSAFEVFKKYHYLSEGHSAPGASYVAFWDDQPVAFFSLRNFPHPKRRAWMVYRVVVLPDFQGVAIGRALHDAVAAAHVCTKSVIGVTSHPAMRDSLNRSQLWRCTAAQKPTFTSRTSTIGSAPSRERYTYSFRYVGPRDREAAAGWGL